MTCNTNKELTANCRLFFLYDIMSDCQLHPLFLLKNKKLIMRKAVLRVMEESYQVNVLCDNRVKC